MTEKQQYETGPRSRHRSQQRKIRPTSSGSRKKKTSLDSSPDVEGDNPERTLHVGQYFNDQGDDSSHPTMKQYVNFEAKDEFSDLILVVDGAKVYAHKFMLAMCSPTFREMISGQNDKDMTIPIPNQKVEHVINFLQWVYPMCTMKITEANAFHLYAIADEFKVKGLMKECEEFIIKAFDKENKLGSEDKYAGNLPTSQLLGAVVFAEQYNCDRVRDKGIKLARKRPIAELMCREFRALGDETQKLIYEKRIQYLEDKLAARDRDFSPVLAPCSRKNK